MAEVDRTCTEVSSDARGGTAPARRKRSAKHRLAVAWTPLVRDIEGDPLTQVRPRRRIAPLFYGRARLAVSAS